MPTLHLLALLSVAQAPAKLSPTQTAAIDAAVRGEMDKQGLVGVAVGVIRNGEVAYLNGYGYADREAKRAVTTKTVFNWASNSKPLAAVAAMQLVEAGKLDLEADVRKYVPEYSDPGKVIRVRHLLCHQSGIPHYSNGKVVPTPPGKPSPRDPVRSLDVFNRSPLLFSPGEKESYSSYAYVLLSAVVERAGGEPFTHQVETRIGKKLGLTTLQLDADDAGQIGWATGYRKDSGGKVVVAKDEAEGWKLGAGGYKSNVEDFAKWGQGLLAGKLVSAATQKRMWADQQTADGKPTGVSLGFSVTVTTVGHSGKQTEATSRMTLYPLRKAGVVVLCNCGFGDPTAVATTVRKALGDK